MLKRKSKRVLSIVLAIAMIVGLFPIAAFAEEGAGDAAPVANSSITASDADSLKSAIETASAGDTVTIPAGTYDIDGLNITKPITLVGTEETVLKGQIIFGNGSFTDASGDSKAICISNISFEPTESTANQAVCFSSGVANYTISVSNCHFDGYVYGVTANSGATGNKLNLSNVSFENTDCAISLKGGNTLGETQTVDLGGALAAQYFTSGPESVNGYYTTLEGFKADQEANSYTPDITVDVNSKIVFSANELQSAITSATDETTITLGSDIVLTSPVMLSSNQNITINGNDHKISFNGTSAAFKITDSASDMVNTPANVTLNINEVKFTGAAGSSSGYAVVIGANSENTSVALNDCTFANLYCGVYANPWTNAEKTDEAPSVSITNSTYENTQYGYSVDEVTVGAVVGAVDTVFTGNTGVQNESESWTSVEAYITRNGVTTVATSFADAMTNAQAGDTITLAKDLEVSTQISPAAGVTIDGNGYKLTYNGSTDNVNGGFLNITDNNVTVKDITINAGGLKHGVQFYCTNGGELNGVTVNGGRYTAVIVNGSTGVTIADSVLNPADGAYTNIEYAMGNNVTTIPSMTINNVTFDDSTLAVYADGNTTARIETAMGGNQTNDEILDKILDSITYTNPNGGSLPISVLFSDGTSEVIREESTYQPPYTGKYSYEIFTKVGENGTISVDRYATEGDDVTITVSPDEAYLLDELTVTTGGKEIEVKDNGDGTYTFKMPSADAKIVVTFAEDPDWEPEPEEPAMPFTDVNENDWFYDVVLYAYDNGLMTGVSATEFAPNQTTTRGMIVSMLARLEGVTSAEDAGFADVAANDWYATAVNWAASVGVVNGYEDNTFRPNAPITREQMAAILYNYADYKGYDVSARADLSDYADAASISSWAEDVLAWANAEGLINGMTATTIDPQGATTRAQTAAMFERFLTAHEA